ncbi:hypothetical protein E2320_015324 [Naja naja]|nr:hypothetical protein E2320_015324 [Naja naja]
MPRFRQRAQAENESISEYVAALHSAALHCGFRDQLDDMLLDQLVCGVRPRLQRLLAKADLTLKQAAELSRSEYRRQTTSKPSTAVNYEDAAYEDEFFEEYCLLAEKPKPQHFCGDKNISNDQVEKLKHLVAFQMRANFISGAVGDDNHPEVAPILKDEDKDCTVD